MTNFEITVLLLLTAYGVTFGIICAELFTRTRRNDSGIKATNKILDLHNSRIDGIIDRMDFLVQIIGDRMDELSKEKACTDKQVGVGKWIRIETKTRYWYGCSCCHTKAPKNDYGNDYFSSYCPECGAKMEVDE